MTWQIEFTPAAEKQLGKLHRDVQKRILKFLREKVGEDPRLSGKPLKGSQREFWRHRDGDYRILSKIQDKQMIILVVRVGHRKSIYN